MITKYTSLSTEESSFYAKCELSTKLNIILKTFLKEKLVYVSKVNANFSIS